MTNIDTLDSFLHSRKRLHLTRSMNAVPRAFGGRSCGRPDQGGNSLRALAAGGPLGLLGGASALLPLASSCWHFFFAGFIAGPLPERQTWTAGSPKKKCQKKNWREKRERLHLQTKGTNQRERPGSQRCSPVATHGARRAAPTLRSQRR